MSEIINQLGQALVNADRAGDTNAARLLAAEIDRLMRQSQKPVPAPQPAEPVFRQNPSLQDISLGGEGQDIDPVATALQQASRELGVEVRAGEAPFKAQLGEAFGMPGARPLEQMMPGFEFRTIQSEGPLKGQQVFRRKGTQEPFTTVANPELYTARGIASGAAGMALPTIGGMGGAALGAVALPLAPGLASVAGAGLGGGFGEAGRQAIGQSVLGLSPLPPGVTREQAEAQGLIGRTGRTKEQIEALQRESAFAAGGQLLGNAISKIARMYRGAGANFRVDPQAYRQDMERVIESIRQTLGPEEANQAIARMNSADFAAAMNQGAVLQAQVDRLRTSGDLGDAFRAAEAEKERYIADLARRLLGIDEQQQQGITALGQRIERTTPQVPPEPRPAPVRTGQVEQLEQQGQAALRQRQEAAIQELTGSRMAGQERQVAQQVAGAAPRGEEAIPGARISPDSPQAAQIIREGIDTARERTLAPLSKRFEDVFAAVGDAKQTPDSVVSVAEKYRDRIAGRLFPTIDPEADPIINSVFSRAFGPPRSYLDEYDNTVQLPPELLPRSLRQLREDSSNLKEALRRANKGQWNGEIGMLNDFITAIDEDIIRLMERTGGPELADEYRATVAGWRQAMDLFQRSGRLGDIQALRPGGREVVADERVAGTIFQGADNSRAVRQAFDALEPEQRDQAIETVRSTLRWEMARRAAPGTGEDVSPQAMANAIRDNQEILSSWFTPSEIQQLQSQATQIANVRRAMGVKADQNFDEWFDGSFWNASPNNVATIYSQLRKNLPATGPNSAQKTIETLQNLTRQRVFQKYAGRDEFGRPAFKAETFFKDMMDDPKVKSYYTEVFGPQFNARGAQLAGELSKFAQKIDADVKALRNTIATEQAVAANAARLQKIAAEKAQSVRSMMRVEGGKFNPTRWADQRWDEMNAENVAQITDYLRAKSPKDLEAFRNLIKNRILREIFSARTDIQKADVLQRSGRNVVDVENLVKLVEDPRRREWLIAAFRDPGQSAGEASQAAYAQIDKLLTVTSLLKPDQAKVILTQKTDPALVSLEQFRRFRNVVFGPLNPKSRIATRAMEWGGDRLNERSAKALLDPQQFLAMQDALKKQTPLGRAIAGAAGTGLLESVEFFVPDNAKNGLNQAKQLFGE